MCRWKVPCNRCPQTRPDSIFVSDLCLCIDGLGEKACNSQTVLLTVFKELSRIYIVFWKQRVLL